MIDPIVAELRAERKRRRLRLADVGEMVGVSLQQIGAWETGVNQPLIGSVRRWAEALGLQLGMVVGSAWRE